MAASSKVELFLFLTFCAVSLTMSSVVKVDAAEGNVTTAKSSGGTRCPQDYKRRVETCIMEAQIAPQAGGGISLIVNKDKITQLCDRGVLVKTIACLEEIHSRCEHNSTILHELDRLYSVDSWRQGAELLCQDTEIFQNNFECMTHSVRSVMTCVLMRTHAFRMQMAFTSPDNHAKLMEVTCNFAEGTVNCLREPLQKECQEDVGERVAEVLYLLLPPSCHTDHLVKDHTPSSS